MSRANEQQIINDGVSGLSHAKERKEVDDLCDAELQSSEGYLLNVFNPGKIQNLSENL
jgi:hypothetical protein